MKFGAVPTQQAAGAILAHSLDLAGRRLRKGVWLTEAHVDALLAQGHAEVTVARLDPEDVHEDAAATALAQALVPDPEAAGIRVGNAGTGRVNLFAAVKGIAQIDAAAINALNAVDPMITVATVPAWQRMDLRGMVATVKIISYAVPRGDLDRARAAASKAGVGLGSGAASGAIRMRPVVHSKVALIQTVVGQEDGEKGQQAMQRRCGALGLSLGPKTLVAHDTQALSAALRQALGSGQADLLLILTGSATSDIDDVAPQAVRQAGGRVSHFGMPVDPGNLLFLGEIAGTPVIGLPGCARSVALNGADWVLERIACGLPVTGADIAAMGVGGLLKEIPVRGHPRAAT